MGLCFAKEKLAKEETDMAQTIQECLDYLAAARESVEELSLAADREEQLKQDESRLKKALDTEKKQMTDAVGSTVKKRRDDINSSYDAEINKAQDQLKKARAKREKAKDQGMKERIAEETSELHEYNKELLAHMKAKFRENHVPSWCRSRLYYSLYMPRWAKEFLGLLIFIALFFLVLPFGIYAALPQHKTLYLALIYVADIVIVGGIYMWIGNHTKLQYAECLKEGRRILDQMHANDKKIKVITGTIRKDRNESLYDLEKYDDEIACAQQELSDIAAKKKDAISSFENVTRNIIADEIEGNHRAEIEEKEQKLQEVNDSLAQLESSIRQQNIHITDTFGPYLGKEYLNTDKLLGLSKLIQSGTASNITEAIEMDKNGVGKTETN